jgi:hypothetical protein
MKKEFIPYEQALALKELGFDEPCLKGYTEGNNRYYLSGLSDIPLPNSHWMYTSDDGKGRDKTCAAPLYQQVFRWFRENYLLFSAVNVDQTMEPKFAYCVSQYESKEFLEHWDTIVFNSDLYYTYEEAELACLKKLIELAKQ